MARFSLARRTRSCQRLMTRSTLSSGGGAAPTAGVLASDGVSSSCHQCPSATMWRLALSEQQVGVHVARVDLPHSSIQCDRMSFLIVGATPSGTCRQPARKSQSDLSLRDVVDSRVHPDCPRKDLPRTRSVVSGTRGSSFSQRPKRW